MRGSTQPRSQSSARCHGVSGSCARSRGSLTSLCSCELVGDQVAARRVRSGSRTQELGWAGDSRTPACAYGSPPTPRGIVGYSRSIAPSRARNAPTLRYLLGERWISRGCSAFCKPETDAKIEKPPQRHSARSALGASILPKSLGPRPNHRLIQRRHVLAGIRAREQRGLPASPARILPAPAAAEVAPHDAIGSEGP